MANEKIINTRIQLKYDSYSALTENNPTLKAGEIAIAYLGPTKTTTELNNGTHPVLFKVGPGAFNSLPWASALAADVYEWAKKNEVKVNTSNEGNAITDVEIKDGFLTFSKSAKFATKAELDAAIEAFGGDLSSITDNDHVYTYTYDEDAGTLSVVETIYVNGKAGESKTILSADFVSHKELTAALESYYTKSEMDDIVDGIDTGVHAVSLSGGTNNGTLKLTVDGNEVDNIAVTGLGSAAYVTVDSLNATAKGYADDVEAKLPTSAAYGVLSVAASDDTITVEGTAQNPTIKVTANKFDAYGAAAAVLGTDADEAGAQTVHGANKLAAAAKARIDGFLDGVDDADATIETLVEIQNFMSSDTGAFVTLSDKVTNIENGTTHTVAKSLDTDAVAQVKAIKVDDADKLDGHDSEYFATAASVSAITEVNTGVIDARITAYNAGKNFGDIITHNANEFAPADIDTGVHSVNLSGGTDNGTLKLTVDGIATDKIAVTGLKSAAYTESTAYATSAQGALADSAVQGVSNIANNGLVMSKSADNKVSVDWDPNVVFVFNCGDSKTLVD